jgi:hypothetical protein
MYLFIALNRGPRSSARRPAQATFLALLFSMLAPFAIAVEAPAQSGSFPIDAGHCGAMRRHHVLGERSPVNCDRLRLVRFEYLDFEGAVRADGEIVVMDSFAGHVLQIFQDLRRRGFPLSKVRPIDRYGGDDLASMADDNTSAFNDRTIAGGAAISLHAYGAAIDINPVRNPFVDGSGSVSPAAGAGYLKRFPEGSEDAAKAGMAEAAIDIFASHGFVEWGGDWTSPIDYQHFQAPRGLAQALAALPPDEAEALVARKVAEYNSCRAGAPANKDGRLTCRRKVFG